MAATQNSSDMAPSGSMSSGKSGGMPYPGIMTKYPDQAKGAGPAWVHDCIPGCPGMPRAPTLTTRPGTEISPYVVCQPPPGLQPQFPGAAGASQGLFIPFPLAPAPSNLPPGVRYQGPNLPPIGMDGQPVWLHPHYPNYKVRGF